MKLLCVACDEPMTLRETQAHDDGSLSVAFACPACGWEVAMLTNAMETQVVRSLGVKLGGRAAPPAPMETVRTALAHQREGVFEAEAPEAVPAPAERPAGGCPFSGAVSDAVAAHTARAPRWTPEAEARIERIPSFIRPRVRESVEAFAREQGHAEIDDAVMDAARGHFGL